MRTVFPDAAKRTSALTSTLRPSILVADDEILIAKDIEQGLIELGYRVADRVANGAAAFTVAAQAKPDLVLMDIRMPGEIDGIEAADRVQRELGIPVVFLTAFSDASTLERAARVHAYGYILKPFREHELRAAVELALHKVDVDRAVLERERLLFTTLRCIGDAVMITDASGRITFMNPVAERITGWDLRTARGEDVDAVLPMTSERNGERIANPVRAAMHKRHVTFLAGDAVANTRNGARIAIDDSASPILDGDALVGGVVVFRDVEKEREERRRSTKLEEQLRLYQRLEAVGQLTSAVAHDFNNILAAVGMTGALLRDSFAADDPRADDAEEIVHAVERGAGLTRQLLGFSRGEPASPRPLDLRLVVMRAEKLLTRLMREDIALRIDMPERELPKVLADPGCIEQLLMNFSVNARDAMPSGGTITISLGESARPAHMPPHIDDAACDRYVVLAVKDSGVGMDDTTRARIFEPFFTTKERDQGTGLGLATCFSIMKQHRGFIDVETAPGAGATFKAFLPVCSPATRDAAAVAGAPRAHGGASRKMFGRVLLVEDDEALRRSLARALRDLGFSVTEASSRGDAAVLAPAKVDLLISDMVLKGGSGFDVRRDVAVRSPGAKVIFMSGYSELPENTAADGALFLAKPFALADLVDRVAALLGSAAAGGVDSRA